MQYQKDQCLHTECKDKIVDFDFVQNLMDLSSLLFNQNEINELKVSSISNRIVVTRSKLIINVKEKYLASVEVESFRDDRE